jgi:hypothetical protein
MITAEVPADVTLAERVILLELTLAILAFVAIPVPETTLPFLSPVVPPENDYI